MYNSDIDNEVIARIEEEAGVICRNCSGKAELTILRKAMSIRTPMKGEGSKHVFLFPTERKEGRARLCYYHRKVKDGDFGAPGWRGQGRRIGI